MFTFRGAVVDQVGRFLLQSVNEVTVACAGDYFITAKKQVKLAVKRHGREPIIVALEPDARGVGVSTTLGRGRGGGGPDGLAVIADSCMAADAAAAGVQALLPKEFGFAQAVRYLKGVPGVRGGVFVVGSGSGSPATWRSPGEGGEAGGAEARRGRAPRRGAPRARQPPPVPLPRPG